MKALDRWNAYGGFLPKINSPLAEICPVSESRGWRSQDRGLLLVIMVPQMVESLSITQTHVAQQ